MATMTLGHQQPAKMYNVISHQQQQQQLSPPQNCVIVSANGGAATPAGTATKSVIQTKRPLAPAPERTASVLVANNNGGDLRCKRKIQFIPYGSSPQQPASVARRNARERNRVKQVNNGFATLRQHIPPSVCAALSPPAGAAAAAAAASVAGRGASKKLSKVETLRMAVEYIRSLQQTIEDHDLELSSNAGSENTHGSDGGSYYSMHSPDSINNHPFTYHPLLTSGGSEASTSPTPSSHGSDGFVSTHGVHHFSNPHDNYENYDPNNADDDELLDVIFSWQQE